MPRRSAKAPRCERNRSIHELLKLDWPIRRIARLFNLSPSQVRRIRASGPEAVPPPPAGLDGRLAASLRREHATDPAMLDWIAARQTARR